jgi:hypothetical protein
MNKYSVTFPLANERAFLDFVNRIGPLVGKFEVVMTSDEPQETRDQPVGAIYKPARTLRRPRKSKINAALVGALKTGRGEVSELKKALVDAGLSAASLSTGLAALQKDGTVKRADNGNYYLASAAAYPEAAQ